MSILKRYAQLFSDYLAKQTDLGLMGVGAQMIDYSIDIVEITKLVQSA